VFSCVEQVESVFGRANHNTAITRPEAQTPGRPPVTNGQAVRPATGLVVAGRLDVGCAWRLLGRAAAAADAICAA